MDPQDYLRYSVLGKLAEVRRVLWALYDESRKPRELKQLGQVTNIIKAEKTLTFLVFKGYNDFTLKRIFKRLEAQGYLSRGRGGRSGFVRVDGEDRRKARIIEYGDPLKYVGQYVGQWKHLGIS